MSGKEKKREKENKYTIDELSELTGYSRRTIRYYVQEGLLDSPAGRGKGGFYFDSHLRQLQLIKKLQERGMSLSSIAKYMELDSDPRRQFYDEYMRPTWKLKMAEDAFLAPDQRANMMKIKMDKSNKLRPQSSSARDVWAKYEIAPGLELNIRRDVEQKQKRKIDDIIRIAREILGKDRE